ncbi:hypothetical protein [Amycolatopsis sp. CA-230715]|uniref:hypothetical protein n=1 Tax=Amycolatopsis sp. CA-230715 TaxID=2745196 RepID=UPI001C02E33E|nr:hypothetical protein [Amycolatopsis sp. CA-230715]QWF85736.1 hypothetical protein HUW46_09216 [Amycolatopsis sp. CA-230715]
MTDIDDKPDDQDTTIDARRVAAHDAVRQALLQENAACSAEWDEQCGAAIVDDAREGAAYAYNAALTAIDTLADAVTRTQPTDTDSALRAELRAVLDAWNDAR